MYPHGVNFDFFKLYPINNPATGKPFFDGKYFLAEKHFFVVTGKYFLTENGKTEKMEDIKCVEIKAVKLRDYEVEMGGYSLWKVPQYITHDRNGIPIHTVR
jgi:hypothetical protein